MRCYTQLNHWGRAGRCALFRVAHLHGQHGRLSQCLLFAFYNNTVSRSVQRMEDDFSEACLTLHGNANVTRASAPAC